jgi:hypothetical protein
MSISYEDGRASSGPCRRVTVRNEDLETNRFVAARTLDGLTHISATLTAEVAEGVIAALGRVADQLFRQHTRDHAVTPDLPVPSRSTLLALALGEVCRRSGAVDVTSSTPPRPEVTYVVRVDDAGRVYDDNGVLLPDKLAEQLLCDPDLFAVIVDSLGVPLDMGRKIRLANSAQRRAIVARDGGCVFPGCDMPFSGSTSTTSTPTTRAAAPMSPACARAVGTTTASTTAQAGRCTPRPTAGSGSRPPPATPSGASATAPNEPVPHHRPSSTDLRAPAPQQLLARDGQPMARTERGCNVTDDVASALARVASGTSGTRPPFACTHDASTRRPSSMQH